MSTLLAAAVAAGQALYLFGPLLLSAAFSGLVHRLDWLRVFRRPIDFGAAFRGRRLFGDNKTWRGVVVALVGCVVGVAIQRMSCDVVPATLQVVAYRSISPLGFGAAMGLGAMAGELPNSFTKRQLRIPPGKATNGWRAIIFYVWDQVDLLIGAWLPLGYWVRPSMGLVVASFAVALLVHPLVAVLGFLIGARKSAR